MCVDAVGVSGGRIFEIAGEADRRREFVARLRVEIGVTDAAVDGAVADTQVGKIARMVEADRDVARYIGHVIVDAGIPAQRELRNQIAEAVGRLTETDRSGEGDRPDRSGDRPIQCGAVLSIGGKQADGRLAAEERRCEHIGRCEKADVCPGADIRIDAGVERGVELADRYFFGHGGAAARRHVCVIVDRRERPPGLLRG